MSIPVPSIYVLKNFNEGSAQVPYFVKISVPIPVNLNSTPSHPGSYFNFNITKYDKNCFLPHIFVISFF